MPGRSTVYSKHCVELLTMLSNPDGQTYHVGCMDLDAARAHGLTEFI